MLVEACLPKMLTFYGRLLHLIYFESMSVCPNIPKFTFVYIQGGQRTSQSRDFDHNVHILLHRKVFALWRKSDLAPVIPYKSKYGKKQL